LYNDNQGARLRVGDHRAAVLAGRGRRVAKAGEQLVLGARGARRVKRRRRKRPRRHRRLAAARRRAARLQLPPHQLRVHAACGAARAVGRPRAPHARAPRGRETPAGPARKDVGSGYQFMYPVLPYPNPGRRRARTAREQLVVRAALGNDAAVHDGHLGGRLHGGQAVRDDDDRAADRHAVQRLLHQRLALRVQRTRGLPARAPPRQRAAARQPSKRLGAL